MGATNRAEIWGKQESDSKAWKTLVQMVRAQYATLPYLLGRFSFLFAKSKEDRCTEGNHTLRAWLREVEEYAEISCLDKEADEKSTTDI